MKPIAHSILLLACASALAQSGDPQTDLPSRIAAERERLTLERSAIEQAHDARAQACWQRFAVNPCLREVRRSRYAALDPLRQQELALNAQERAWRVEQREERLREKQDAQEKRP